MPDASGAGAEAQDAAVVVNYDQPRSDELQQADRVRLAESAVDFIQRQVDELGDAPATVEAKYAKINKGYKSELAEAKKQVAAYARMLKKAKDDLAKAQGD